MCIFALQLRGIYLKTGKFRYFVVMKRIILFLLLLGLAACAKIVMPTGGPQDTTPPRLDTLRSTPLVQTNFQGNTLEFRFDEFIVINNALKELIISPPLQYSPELTAKRRTAILKFSDKDTLRANTTYSIQFNEAIGDFTEGNKVKNLVAVFSTGDKIDSSEFRVRVFDNATGQAAEGIHVMLYRDMDDSIVYREKPYYAALTNASGMAHLRYLQDGEYKLFALKDENMNMFYDLPTEKIGFIDGTVTVPAEGVQEMRIFAADQRTQLTDTESRPFGKSVFIFNNPPENLIIKSESEDAILSAYANGDSIIVWRSPELSGDVRFLLDSVGVVKDTVKMKIKAVDSTRYAKRGYFSNRLKTITVNPVHGKEIETIRPIKEIVKDSIQLVDTSGKEWTFDVSPDSINSTVLKFRASKEGDFTLRYKPGALIDYYGYSLKDTLEFPVKVMAKNDLCKLIIELETLDSTAQYIFTLELGDEVIAKKIINKASSKTLEFPGMEADNYKLRLVNDENFNGKEDKGSYRTKQQPESFVIKEIQGMRAGWDFQESISPNIE